MKLHFQSPAVDYAKNDTIRFSRAHENSARYSQEQSVESVSNQNLVNSYFQIFDEDYTEVEIKNLISARLQPSYKLPTVHDNQQLLSKAGGLLDFSLSV